jgi:hypothetical protein
MKFTYEDVKSRVTMTDILNHYGIEKKPLGNIKCPIHGGTSENFSVHDQDHKWTCHSHGCGKGSSVIDFVSLMDGITAQEAFIKIKEWSGMVDDKPQARSKPAKPFKSVKPPTKYTYRHADGKLAYHIDVEYLSNGTKTKKNCIPELPNGTHRLPKEAKTLYNLPAITECGEDYVCFAEGEKTAEALISCGFVGTTFSGGSGAWLDQYAELLLDKNVVLMPDADEMGEKWLKAVSEGLAGKVASLRTVTVPDKFVIKCPKYKGHDFADMLAESNTEYAINWLTDEILKVEVIDRGVDRSSFNVMTDVCANAIETAQNMSDVDCMDLAVMFGTPMHVLVRASDLMMIIAPTGVGKSRVLANMPFVYPNLNFAIFDLELSLYQLGMRGVAYDNRLSFEVAERKVRSGQKVRSPKIENVFLPKISSLNIEKLKTEVDRLEKVQNRRIHVVAVDYISKMNRTGGSMTDSIIANCSDLKRYLVEEDRMGIITTQSRRINDKEMKYNMPKKEDAIYTSAIEQNCQQAMCFCFAQNDHNTLLCNCDKYTHGTEPSIWTELDVSDMRIKYKGIHESTEDEW